MVASGITQPDLKRRLKNTVKKALDINRLYSRAVGGENRPAFYNIDETYPSTQQGATAPVSQTTQLTVIVD